MAHSAKKLYLYENNNSKCIIKTKQKTHKKHCKNALQQCNIGGFICMYTKTPEKVKTSPFDSFSFLVDKVVSPNL